MSYTNGLDKPDLYFNTVLWTGNGVDDRSITGVGFQPDWVWLKQRNGTNYHTSFDSVRGATKRIFPNVTEAEDTNADSLQAFETDGFQVGTNGGINGNTNTYVAWNWLGGGTASSNTDGSITSSVSANTTSGFSIVTYSGNGTGGATVGHGLGSALGLIILKCRSTAGTSWQMFHKSLGATKSINLEDTAAAATSTAYWNDTAPTSSVFSLGTGGDFNNGSRTYVAYCFAEKKGFSKFGSYIGNGSTSSGTFIYTGFKPAFVMVKNTTNINTFWVMVDSVRKPTNPANANLYANTSEAEGTTDYLHFFSNGFSPLKSASSWVNESGSNYIYMAFAENPFVTSTGIPTTAR